MHNFFKLPAAKFNLGGVYMTPGRLSPWGEFTPVPSHGSIFVYMIPPQNVMPARVWKLIRFSLINLLSQ